MILANYSHGGERKVNDVKKIIGLLAILPLFMAIISLDYIDEAEAKLVRDKHVKLTEPEPDVDLSLTQMFEPKLVKSDEVSVRTAGGETISTPATDEKTYQVVYRIQNDGTTNVNNIMISVHSDTETVDGKLSGWLDPKHSSITVLIKAVDPVLIDAKIIGYQI